MQNIIVGQNQVQNQQIKALMEEALKSGASKLPKVAM